VLVENFVLLVEDDAPLRRSLEKFLNQAGYAFESCSTAREALALAENLRHDVVILEYHLPDADGPALIEKLNLLRPAAAIVISEYDFQAVANDLDRVKIDMFLKKPFDLVDFEAALSSASSRAGKLIRKDDWQPEGLPASTVRQGTLGNGS
jgi:DNA-binding response OmpR family regulator